MERDHGKIELRSIRRRVARLPTALVVLALALVAFWIDAPAAGLLWIGGAVGLVWVQRERVTVRVDPEWLLVWRQFPWFARAQLERYALTGIAAAEPAQVNDGWVVCVRMQPPFQTHRVEIPTESMREAASLAHTLTEESAAARTRVDPAVARSRIVVPDALAELMDRER
jgi:hypothetical protein